MGKSYYLEWVVKENEAFNNWNALGYKTYTVDDIPDWVKKRICQNCYYGESDVIYDLIRNTKKNCRGKKRFATVNGVCYFLESGYRKIIDVVKRKGILREDEIQKWEEEVFGAGD